MNPDLRYRSLLLRAVERRRLRVAWVDEDIERAGWEVLEQHADVKLSLTDAVSAVIARRSRIQEFFAFDRDFEALGLVVAPVG